MSVIYLIFMLISGILINGILYKKNPHLSVWKHMGIFIAIMIPYAIITTILLDLIGIPR